MEGLLSTGHIPFIFFYFEYLWAVCSFACPANVLLEFLFCLSLKTIKSRTRKLFVHLILPAGGGGMTASRPQPLVRPLEKVVIDPTSQRLGVMDFK